jgi:hypothetical protein
VAEGEASVPMHGDTAAAVAAAAECENGIICDGKHKCASAHAWAAQHAPHSYV